MISETYEDGWTPTGDEYLGPDWSTVWALSELCDDPVLLAATADAFRMPDRSTGRVDADAAQERQEQRLAAAIALFANPHAPTDTLLGIVEGLDEHALRRVLQAASGAAAQAARARLSALQAATAAREAALCQVPADEELARLPDPSGELRKHLRWLRGPAKQRDAITAALLRSRFTTPDILRELRAHAVLDSPEQVEQAATMIASTCADRSARWGALRDQLKESGSKTLTFGAWLDQLVK